MLILRCMGVQIVDGFFYRGKGLALSGPVQPSLHEILHVETGARPFLRSLGEEWKLLPPDAMQLFHLFDAIPPKARAVLFRQIENPTFPVESREVRWHPAFRSEERRVGKECFSTCRFRGAQSHKK